eukprot:CAMPEP_0197666304 /NCGR_PEP_ID=MMETSP1338-20131121/62141_1 /TAXON_ID=43686 ORGANISM="Pelagodinium beii, Strain RCC1491" /NCGR_SAMPLE_ID=MMETSP1338 /ASSEMBLY_ACC=CAM_ASM_000754 /LENGTH=50 /DNA_ID=CAMNT_0043245317 /DNA_START=39 /DNA_END=191 /DNA_ORIENTATION=+
MKAEASPQYRSDFLLHTDFKYWNEGRFILVLLLATHSTESLESTLCKIEF